jgi:hypothetical protein
VSDEGKPRCDAARKDWTRCTRMATQIACDQHGHSIALCSLHARRFDLHSDEYPVFVFGSDEAERARQAAFVKPPARPQQRDAAALQRIAEMQEMRTGGATYRAIAERFGVSRERVWQLLGKHRQGAS